MLGAEVSDSLVAMASDGISIALEEQPAPGADARLWIALSPPADPGLPGELLAQFRSRGFVVQGFADRAALLAAWLEGFDTVALLHLSQRQLSVSVAARDADGAALRRHVPLPGGTAALHDAWLTLAAQSLVQQTRFDPLYEPSREAQLRARMAVLAATAQRDGQARCEVETGTGVVELALSRDQVASASQPVLGPLAAALQALAATHGEAALLVPASLLDIPGLDAVVAGARFARQYRIDDGLAARAASALAPSGAAAAGGVPYRTRLPLLAAPAPADVLMPLLAGDHEARAMATHVVYRGRVLPIPASTGLVIGREPGPAPALRLPEGVAGLSRRHCTLRRDGLRTQVIDHSSHGTFIDGARVRGRALLPAGSTLKVGHPGIELPLVAIEAE